jgi:hypothetical protein
MSGGRLLPLEGDVHERLEVIQPERGAVVPGTGLILEWTRKGRGEERSVFAPFCQIVALMLPHRSVVAGRFDCWLVAMVFPPCVK